MRVRGNIILEAEEKGIPGYVGEETLTTLLPAVMQKVGNEPVKLNGASKISFQTVLGVPPGYF